MAGNRLIQRVRALSISLFKTLRNIWQGSTRQLSADVQPNEALTSFVFRQNQIVRPTNKIHHSRLMPRRNRENQNKGSSPLLAYWSTSKWPGNPGRGRRHEISAPISFGAWNFWPVGFR